MGLITALLVAVVSIVTSASSQEDKAWGLGNIWNHRRLRSEVAFLMPEARSISELTKDFCPERRQRIEEHKEQLRQQLILAALHKAVPNRPD